MSRLLGIDPGSRQTGFGIVETRERRIVYVASGCIRPHGEELPPRLGEIFENLGSLIETYRPEAVALEKVFVHKNVDSALKLGQARGAALAAVVTRGLPVHEYAPNAIKQAIVGRGHADKAQIQHMVKVLLNLTQSPQADAADALAVALCHVHHQQYGLDMPRSKTPKRRGGWRDYRPE